MHRNLANGNCPWLGEAGNSNEYNVCKTDSPYFLASLPSLALCFQLVPHLCLTARVYLNTQKYGLFCSLMFLRCISSKHSSGSDAYHCSRAVCRGRCDSSLGSLLAHHHFIVSCDNEVAVTVINSGITRDPFMQRCLPQLWFTAVSYTHLTLPTSDLV